jgi:hypothetical protein
LTARIKKIEVLTKRLDQLAESHPQTSGAVILNDNKINDLNVSVASLETECAKPV